MADDDFEFDPDHYDELLARGADYSEYDDRDGLGGCESMFMGRVDLDADRREDEGASDWCLLKKAIRRVKILRIGEPETPYYRIGRYEALETVDGGMGMVVIGRDPDLDRKVAIKLWKAEGPMAELALLAEAQTLAKLKHPNVVSVYDVGKYESSVYFVMESVEGTNGHDWILKRTPTWQEVRAVFMAAGSGLAAAHAAGIHHRDFKPANMLVGHDGRVLVLDFGIAGTLHSTQDSSDPGPAPGSSTSRIRGPTGAGTVAYMAPERIRGRQGDARSDQFSFCVSMWTALHRMRPYPGGSSEELLKSIARGVLRTGTGTAQVPHWLSRIVRRGLAEDPRMRYRDMHELLEALRRGPDGGELIDDEGRSGAGSSGALGRLLSSYRTGGSSDSAELEALVDEVARRLQLKRAGATNDEALRIGSNGGLAALPRQSALLLFVSVISTISAVFTLLLVGMMLRPATPVAVEPRPVAVDEGPLSMILEDVDADDFSKAETRWVEVHEADSEQALSDGESLTIARACLRRAEELEALNPKSALQAAKMARDVALFVMNVGSSSNAKEAGRQLYSEATAVIGRLPAPDDPNSDYSSKQSTVPSRF